MISLYPFPSFWARKLVTFRLKWASNVARLDRGKICHCKVWTDHTWQKTKQTKQTKKVELVWQHVASLLQFSKWKHSSVVTIWRFERSFFAVAILVFWNWVWRAKTKQLWNHKLNLQNNLDVDEDLKWLTETFNSPAKFLQRSSIREAFPKD